MMCRPRGGRSAPRYHHIKDAAERKCFAELERLAKEPKEKPLTQTEIHILALTAMAAKANEEIRSLRLLMDK